MTNKKYALSVIKRGEYMDFHHFNLKLEEIFCGNKKLFAFPKIYIDANNNLYYNSLDSVCLSESYITKKNCFYNNNEMLIDILKIKKEFKVHDLYLEFDEISLSLIKVPIYYSVDEYHFNELISDVFTLTMIKKLCKQKNEEALLVSIINYLKLFDLNKSIFIMQYISFYNMVTQHQLSRIYIEYIRHLNKKNLFSTRNNEKLTQKAIFRYFSIKEIKLA